MKRHWPIILVTTVFVVSNIIWIVLDQAPPLWDMAGHSVQAASLARGIFTNTIYPPASYAVTAMCFRLFGFYPDVPQYSLLFWVL